MFNAIEFAPLQDYERAALIFAVLAYPGSTEINKRLELFTSLCSWFIRDRARRDQNWANSNQAVKPQYLARSESDLKKDMRSLERRLRDRLAAGHMALSMLRTLAEGEDAPTIHALCASVTAELGIECPKNVASRVWRPGLPVLPLCAAWVVTCAQHLREYGWLPTISDLAEDEGLLLVVLMRTELYETSLRDSPLKLDPASLVQLSLASV